MPSSTVPLTWPTRQEIDKVLDALSKGMNEYDLLNMRLHALLRQDHDDHLPEGVPPPTLEDIGGLARFVELARLDIETLGRWVGEASRTYKRAAYHVADDGGDDARPSLDHESRAVPKLHLLLPRRHFNRRQPRRRGGVHHRRDAQADRHPDRPGLRHLRELPQEELGCDPGMVPTERVHMPVTLCADCAARTGANVVDASLIGSNKPVFTYSQPRGDDA
ncbi:MAG: hypothetical protein ABIP53_02480 [Candidatus Limnocylindrales bacterium]